MYRQVETWAPGLAIMEQLARDNYRIKEPWEFDLFSRYMSFKDVTTLSEGRRSDETAVAKVLVYLYAGG